MKNEHTLIYGLGGFLVGVVLAMLFTTNAVNNNMTGIMRMMGMRVAQPSTMQQAKQTNEMGMGSSMTEMMESMQGHEGENFDKAFIEAMIPHHEGAIEMAKQAQKKAQHAELKQLADNIIAAQTKEIEQMRQWMANW